MKRVSRKNVSNIMSDIYPPQGSVIGAPPAPRILAVGRRNRGNVMPEKPRVRFTAVFVGLLLIIGGTYTALLFASGGKFLAAAHSFKGNIRESLTAMVDFDTRSADTALRAAQEDITDIRDRGERFGIWRFTSALGTIWPNVKRIPEVLSSVEDATRASLAFNTHIEELKNEGISMFLNGNGEEFIAILELIRNDIDIIERNGKHLLATAADIPFAQALIQHEKTISALTDLDRGKEFFDALIPFLKAQTPVHVAVFFQNPSEIRPAGGFIGSFADITIHEGALEETSVYDIYYPDGRLDAKIVPPKPLQLITTKLGARDANWFFDFPISAEKVTSLLEESTIYREQRVSFDLAVAINTDVIASIFDMIGPIELPGYETTLTKENFLEEIQTEVEAGLSKAQGEPKRILADLTPRIFARVQEFDDKEKHDLFTVLGQHLKQKDIMLYAENKKMQNFFAHYGFDGSVYQLPVGYNGDYLAVVNANIAGGKTDIFIDQRIVLTSSIDITGTVSNEVVITRTHRGGNEDLWLYNVDNKNYLRVYVPPRPRLLEIMGGIARKILPPIDYEKHEYTTDPDIERADAKELEFGKAVFDAWQILRPGTNQTLTFTYENGERARISDGATYTFVFEKQSGVRGGINLSIEAPPGYNWDESGTTVFSYANDDPDGRTILTLTMRKN